MVAKEYLKDCRKCPDFRKPKLGEVLQPQQGFCEYGAKPKRLLLDLEKTFISKRSCNLRLK